MYGDCKRCGAKDIGGDAPDPCIGKLPGVVSACCGHGTHEGHIRFENRAKIILDKEGQWRDGLSWHKNRRED